MGELDFAYALNLLKQGARVARHGWNGKGMWLVLVQNDDYYNYPGPVFRSWHTAYDYDLHPWIGLKTADGQFVPWTPSQTDLLAKDWYEVKE